MKYVWEDLPERKNCFTIKNTAMVNLNTGKPIQHYSTNTRITLVQKCVTPGKTFYRTSDAAHHCLNYAFEASAFGLPNEKAPSAPSSTNTFSHTHSTVKPDLKQTPSQNASSPKGGEEKLGIRWIKKLFRRKNG